MIISCEYCLKPENKIAHWKPYDLTKYFIACEDNCFRKQIDDEFVIDYWITTAIRLEYEY